MQEWENRFNPFNSWKVLFWSENLKKIANGDFPPPVQVDIDPTNKCNFRCPHCNAWEARTKNPGTLTKKHMLEIADFCGKWGVKGACIAGGGEPLMNPHTGSLIERLRNHGNNIESGIITNGFLLENEIADIIAETSRWCGISLDAATSETFSKIKGLPKTSHRFDVVIKNIKRLVALRNENKTYLEVAVKFLIHPYNAHEIYDSAKLAKEMGVDHFHCRPCGLDNIAIGREESQADVAALTDMINIQLEKIFALNDDNFQAFGIRHKFNPNFTRKVNFSKCWAIPLIVTFAANGNLELCFDRRGDEDLVMTSHLDLTNIKQFWNSREHKEMIDKIDVSKCPRCTFGPYNEMIEEIIIKDKMCRNFP